MAIKAEVWSGSAPWACVPVRPQTSGIRKRLAPTWTRSSAKRIYAAAPSAVNGNIRQISALEIAVIQFSHVPLHDLAIYVIAVGIVAGPAGIHPPKRAFGRACDYSSS